MMMEVSKRGPVVTALNAPGSATPPIFFFLSSVLFFVLCIVVHTIAHAHLPPMQAISFTTNKVYTQDLKKGQVEIMNFQGRAGIHSS